MSGSMMSSTIASGRNSRASGERPAAVGGGADLPALVAQGHLQQVGERSARRRRRARGRGCRRRGGCRGELADGGLVGRFSRHGALQYPRRSYEPSMSRRLSIGCGRSRRPALHSVVHQPAAIGRRSRPRARGITRTRHPPARSTMFGTYLRRELAERRKQTVIIAIGMALAIALVIIVNSVAAGVQDAQATVLAVRLRRRHRHHRQPDRRRRRPTASGRPRPALRLRRGRRARPTTARPSVSQSRLTAGRGTTTFDATALDTVHGRRQRAPRRRNPVAHEHHLQRRAARLQPGRRRPGRRRRHRRSGAAPRPGGADGAGGSSFDVDSLHRARPRPRGAAVGPLSAVTLADGRTLAADDAGTDVAVLDTDYATSAELAVGDTIDDRRHRLRGRRHRHLDVGDAATASNVYIPLDVAQTLVGRRRQDLDHLRAGRVVDRHRAGPGRPRDGAARRHRVSTQADLASSVSGSLSHGVDLVVEPRHLAVDHSCSPPRSSSRSCSPSRASPAAPASSAR